MVKRRKQNKSFATLIIAIGLVLLSWTAFGKKYHTHDDCQALANSDTLYAGSVTDAIEASRTTLCAFCARNDGIEGELKIEDAE